VIAVDEARAPGAEAVAAHGDQVGPERRRGPARWVTSMIRGYQLARSGRPTGCRYLPTCSEYAVEAIGGYGTLRGSALALRRVARCGPWGGHGIDPVPERRTPCRP
jgi:uncharacterized protein